MVVYFIDIGKSAIEIDLDLFKARGFGLDI